MFGVKFGKDTFDNADGITGVGQIALKNYLLVFVNCNGLYRGRARVDSKPYGVLTIRRISANPDACLGMTSLEFFVILFAFEKRVAGCVAAVAVISLNLLNEIVKRRIRFLVRNKRCAERNERKRLLGAITCGSKRFIKAVAKLRKKGKRSSEIYYISVYLSSLRQTGNSLVDNGIQNTCTNIGF